MKEIIWNFKEVDLLAHKILFLMLFIMTSGGVIKAQISGISGSKLCVPDAGTVLIDSFEFEPSVLVFNSSSSFDDTGEIVPAGGEKIQSDLFFRITMGILEDLEAGISFSHSIDQIFLGTKYSLRSKGPIKIALSAGTAFPAGNKFIPDSVNNYLHHQTLSCGGVLSAAMGEKASIDVTLGITHLFRTQLYNYMIWYGIDYGFMLSNSLQGVIEVGGYNSFNGDPAQSKITISPGATINVTKNLLAVIAMQIDITGRNADKFTGYSMAFTMSF